MTPTELGLPHRPPFLFVDTVLECIPGQRAWGQRTFQADDPVFAGHFPGNALVPGVLLTEALAQVAGIAIGRPNELYFLTAIRTMKFLRPVRPGELIDLRADQTNVLDTFHHFDVSAHVGDEIAARGQLVLVRVG
jgi:3-hydroxyacyl-[acyl-carrier-protein] dehydratase